MMGNNVRAGPHPALPPPSFGHLPPQAGEAGKRKRGEGWGGPMTIIGPYREGAAGGVKDGT